MDWKKLISPLTPYIDKLNPYMGTVREYGQKAVEFVEDQLQSTPLFIKTQLEYDEIFATKRLILIAYDPTHLVAQDVRLLSSVWMTRAFMDNATLRFIDLIESAEFARNIWLIWPIDMRVRYMGDDSVHLTEIADIKTWWQSPIYQKQNQIISDAPVDPLAIL